MEADQIAIALRVAEEQRHHGKAQFFWVWGALLVMCGVMLVVTAVLGLIGIKMVQRATKQPLPEQAIAEAELTIDELQDAGTA